MHGDAARFANTHAQSKTLEQDHMLASCTNKTVSQNFLYLHEQFAIINYIIHRIELVIPAYKYSQTKEMIILTHYARESDSISYHNIIYSHLREDKHHKLWWKLWGNLEVFKRQDIFWDSLVNAYCMGERLYYNEQGKTVAAPHVSATGKRKPRKSIVKH